MTAIKLQKASSFGHTHANVVATYVHIDWSC